MSTPFFRPASVKETVALLATYGDGACLVNGGTDIVEKIAQGRVQPKAIIYMHDIPELRKVALDNDSLCIGGAASYAALSAFPGIAPFTALCEAVAEIGSPAIRVMGTPAGNVGTAVPAADCNVALLALGAEFVLESVQGRRTVAAENMFTGYCTTLRRADELIREIRIPALLPHSGSAFVKLAKRKAQDIAQVSAGVWLQVENGRCIQARVALGAVNSRAVRAGSMERVLADVPFAQALEQIRGMVPEEASLRSPRNKAYKEAVIGVVVARAAEQAFQHSTGRD